MGVLQGPKGEAFLMSEVSLYCRTLRRCVSLISSNDCRGTSLTRKRTPLGPYDRPTPRGLRGSSPDKRDHARLGLAPPGNLERESREHAPEALAYRCTLVIRNSAQGYLAQ